MVEVKSFDDPSAVVGVTFGSKILESIGPNGRIWVNPEDPISFVDVDPISATYRGLGSAGSSAGNGDIDLDGLPITITETGQWNIRVNGSLYSSSGTGRVSGKFAFNDAPNGGGTELVETAYVSNNSISGVGSWTLPESVGSFAFTKGQVIYPRKIHNTGSANSANTFTIDLEPQFQVAVATPSATNVTERQLAVTSPTATPDITIIEENPGRYYVNVTDGKKLVLGAVADCTVKLTSALDGLIIAQATGPNPTVTFTEITVPVSKIVDYVHVERNAGSSVTLGNLIFLVPTGGNRSLMVKTVSGSLTATSHNYWSGGSDTDERALFMDNINYRRVHPNWNFTQGGQRQEVKIRMPDGSFYEFAWIVSHAYAGNMMHGAYYK